MADEWHWELLGPDGGPTSVDGGDGGAFPTQSEAESWVGEQWPTLWEAGVEAVTLRHGDTVVYGPMSLRPGP